MTANSGSPSEPPKGQGFKVTLTQGIIGAVSLAGTTAIPLLVNRYLAPPTAAESPAPAAQVSPAPATTQASPSAVPAAAPGQVVPGQTVQTQTGSVMQLPVEPVEGKNGKKKKHD
ncbi:MULTISPECIES: hypothetical protein [Trichocoleus]|uniref:Uncharacterized protein n=1 Tax=Trichocoleus desertorum GB2-A4 TaxID=2933944 RepID=A0ABV0JD53_9CYAN|nr:hypothetical protein [Trichocoleus sp. FACHB-46]MBD1864351.1 hypothetical protein [Trichocoleus sp. FACHB-46]